MIAQLSGKLEDQFRIAVVFHHSSSWGLLVHILGGLCEVTIALTQMHVIPARENGFFSTFPELHHRVDQPSVAADSPAKMSTAPPCRH
jgi:hypothetical protein